MGRSALIAGVVVGLACAGCAERAARARVVPGLVATLRVSRARSARSERRADQLRWEMNVGLRWRAGVPVATAPWVRRARLRTTERVRSEPVPCANEALCAWERAARERALLEVAP